MSVSGVTHLSVCLPHRLSCDPRSRVEAFDGDGADLVFWDLGKGIEGRVGQDIGSRLGKLHEGDKDLARSHGLGDLGVCGQFAPTGRESNRRSSFEAKSPGIVRVDSDLDLLAQSLGAESET